MAIRVHLANRNAKGELYDDHNRGDSTAVSEEGELRVFDSAGTQIGCYADDTWTSYETI